MFKKIWAKIAFICLGIASTAWFLIRVIPKPSRATYPCMRAAAPFMSSFIIWILTLTGTALAFKKFRETIAKAKYIPAVGFVLVFFTMLIINDLSSANKASALNLVDASYFKANEPIGVAQGYKPGRVAWVWNTAATDENLEVTNDKTNWCVNYTNANAVESMLNDVLRLYTDETNVETSWDVLFKHFNEKQNKGAVGYTKGEKVMIKVNITNSSQEGSSMAKTKNWNRMDSTPELLLALLKQLIENVGVEQEDIFIGDPFRNFRNEYWDLCYAVYPKVNYIDGRGTNGRYKSTPSSEKVMKFSDKKYQYRIAQEYIDAEYFINMPALKSHDSAGITLGIKNHQGSILKDGDDPDEQSAFDMHYAFPDNDYKEGGAHRYRHLVDYAGHQQLGGKTLITIIDGIWAGRRWEGFVEKWQMAPFNGDYPNSLFVSQDLLAIDAVCFDFLLEEYKFKDDNDKYPYMSGTDDYLLQAADPANWAEGITYDPENDGTPLKSLGVYEHWNNSTEMKYTRNLGTGEGIELVSLFKTEIPSIITTTNGLPSNEIKSIYVDSSDVVWIGSDKGLTRYDGTKTTTYNSDNNLKNNSVNDIAYEQTAYGHELWIATNGGLTVASFNSDGVTGATTYTTANSDITDTVVNAVMVDEFHNRWIGTENAINVFKGSEWSNLTEGVTAYGNIFNFSEINITDIEPYKIDTITYALVATAGEGVLRLFNDEVDGLTGASTFGQPWSSLNSNHVNAVSAGEVKQWYATDMGVTEHADEKAKGDWISYNVEEHKLEDDFITDILIDPLKNVWVGTSKGLNIIKTDGVINKFTEEEGLLNNQVNVIESDTKGNVWVGTSGGIHWFTEVPGIDVRTSSKYVKENKKALLYPNPATDFIHLEINAEKAEMIQISIYNLKGQLIDVPIEQKFDGGRFKTTIDISNSIYYKKGIYLLRIETEGHSQILKFNKI